MANVCQKVKRLMAGNQPPQSFYDRAKEAIGSSVGQAAFNYVRGAVPRIAVDNSVNAGVRSLVDAVNTGAVSFAGSTVNQASNAVLGAAGISGDRSLVPANPQNDTIFNNAQTAATTIGNSLISGVIEEADLPGPINSLSALAFLQQHASNQPIDITDPDCGVTPYARDLIQYAPKHNFMFMVKFIFRADYENLALRDIRGDDDSSDDGKSKSEEIKFHYLCRRFTRPEIDIEYEDVNMYNFRTKATRKINYGDVELTLYDDIQNSTMEFLEKYLKVRSPIANRTPSEGDLYEFRGMDFNNTAGASGGANALPSSSASMGGLVNENKAVLKQVEVYHIYSYGSKVNKFTFINPKILQFRMSDFDMEPQTEPANVDIRMSYDSMYIENGIEVPLPQLQETSKLGERFIRKFDKNGAPVGG